MNECMNPAQSQAARRCSKQISWSQDLPEIKGLHAGISVGQLSRGKPKLGLRKAGSMAMLCSWDFLLKQHVQVTFQGSGKQGKEDSTAAFRLC